MRSTEPFDLLRRGAMFLLALYGALAWLGVLITLPEASGARGWLHPLAGGMALAASLALSDRAARPASLRASITLLLAFSLVPLAFGAGTSPFAQRMWPDDARDWPALLCVLGWLAWGADVWRGRSGPGRLQALSALLLICGGALIVAGNFLRLDLMYAQPALSAHPLALAGALFVLALILLRSRATQREAEGREEALISRIGLGLLCIIAFATGLISFTALQTEIESALYQQLQARLQNRQFVFYAALDALHLNAAPLVRDRDFGQRLAQTTLATDRAQRAALLQNVENLLPPLNPSQTARASIERAVAIRDLAGNPLAQSGEFIAGDTLWATARRRSEVSLMWQAGLPFALQGLDIEDAQRARVGQVLVQHPMPTWELLFNTSDDLGSTGQMAICGLHEGRLRCLRSRGQSAIWEPAAAGIRAPIEAAALYGESGSLTTPQFVRDENQRMLVIAYRPMGRLILSKQLTSNGLMMMLTDRADAFYAPLRRHLHRVLLFAIPTIAFGGLLLMLLMRPLVRALRDKQARFRELTELSSDGYWVMDERLRFVELVGQRLAASGIVLAEWRGQRIDTLPVPAEATAAASELIARLTNRETFVAVSLPLQLGKSATQRHLELSGAPQYDRGRFVGYRGVCIDVTDKRLADENLRRAQQELMRSEKLASLGSLVAGVAHELNTPLGNGITAASSLASDVRNFNRTLESGALKRSALQQFTEQANESTALIERSLARAAHIVQQFKQVAVDQSSDERRSFDLREVVDELSSVLHPRFKAKGLSLQITIPPGIRIDGYPGALEQVIENLALNAQLHAFEGGGPGTLTLSAERLDSERVRIEVRDNGRGMSTEELARAFEPFYTTRLGTGGSGLGLYIVHSIVNDVLGGTVKLTSAPGEGCTATLDLPLLAP